MRKLVIAALVTAVSAGSAFAQQVIRMGTEGAYEPYNFINDKGEIDGFERELGDKLCEIAGYTCEWVKNDWDTIIPNLLSGNYDTIMAGMSITDERKEKIDFTQNYFPPAASAYVALAGADDSVINGNIAAQVNTIQSAYIAESDATLIEFAIADETVAAVRNGEADAVFADKDYLQKIVDESNGELKFVGEDVQLGGGVGMGVRKSDTEMRDKFDAAITQLKGDGTLNAMIEKWFNIKDAF
ncbi:MAG: amino acid ABC transporter [Alphaproteobacteria bacterium]|nr:MAG: amino acid ABC transporter [Alphaproteobacteria bacterium]